MPANKKRTKSVTKYPRNSFVAFLTDPMISTALIVFGLVALVLALIEFTTATTI